MAEVASSAGTVMTVESKAERLVRFNISNWPRSVMSVYCLGLLAKGVAFFITDSTFKIETELARYCLKLAHHLSSWTSEQQDIVLPFLKGTSCVTIKLHAVV